MGESLEQHADSTAGLYQAVSHDWSGVEPAGQCACDYDRSIVYFLSIKKSIDGRGGQLID